MINVLIVCIIIQCLSHSADPAAVSEFTNPSTKKALAEHLGQALQLGWDHLSPLFQKFTKDVRDTSCVHEAILKAQLLNSAEK